jgi:hypothetical protein
MIEMTDEIERDILLRLAALRRREILRSRKCGAKTRTGMPCIVKPVWGSKRCRFHGGLSTGPRTAEGRQRIAEAQRKRWAKARLK